MSQFHLRCKKTAKRFLQTVVIVDDEAYIEPVQSPGVLEKPDRHTMESSPLITAAESMTSASGETRGNAGKVGRPDDRGTHRLDTRTLVESFSKQGLICAVVAPRSSTDPSDIVDLSVKRTDIVILDWQLDGDNGRRTLAILGSILKEDAGQRLRLIAIYTGEQRISEIGQSIVRECSGSERQFDVYQHNTVLSHRHCRIVIYSKSNLPTHLSNRFLSESKLPEALIGDFATMVKGLLPNIALMSLASVRENVHKVLDRFDAKLDPALLTHRACLPIPDDSQQHMVSQLASELHAIMDDAVATGEPAGMNAIREWLDFSLGVDKEIDFGEGRTASRDQVITLLERGLKQTDNLSISKERGFRLLTKGFSKDENLDYQLDLRLAWMFNFRTVFNAPPPVLQLGTVLRKSDDADKPYFLCMRPKCDSVGLQDRTAFLLLPLVAPQSNSIQLVLHAGGDTYRRVSVCMEIDQWLLVNFVPDQNRRSVVAKGNYPHFYFTDENGVQLDWLGEMKAEFAQRVAQHFAAGLSRVPINNSEWLRRKEKEGR